MLTEQQIQDEIARRKKIERPYGIIGLVLSVPLVPLFIWMDRTNPGESPKILAWIALFMGSSCALIFIGSFRASRFKLRCPHCLCDLTCQLADLIRTHHCRTCRELIVGEIPAPDTVPVDARLTPKEIRKRRRRRKQECDNRPLVEFALILMFFSGLLGVSSSRFPYNLIWLSALLTSGISYIHLFIQYRKCAGEIRTLCPNCQTCLNDREMIVLRTGRCPVCNCLILRKDPRLDALRARHMRYSQFRIHRDLGLTVHRLLWGLALFQGFLTFFCYLNHQEPNAPNPKLHFFVSLFGLGLFGVSVYVWLRSRNRRCLYPLIIMALMVAYTSTLAWLEFTAP